MYRADGGVIAYHLVLVVLLVVSCGDESVRINEAQSMKLGGDERIIVVSDHAQKSFINNLCEAIDAHSQLHKTEKPGVIYLSQLNSVLSHSKPVALETNECIYIYCSEEVARQEYYHHQKNRMMVDLSKYLFPDIDIAEYYENAEPHQYIDMDYLQSLDGYDRARITIVVNNIFGKCKMGERGDYMLNFIGGDCNYVVADKVVMQHEERYLESVLGKDVIIASALYPDQKFDLHTYYGRPNFVINNSLGQVESHLLNCGNLFNYFHSNPQEVEK